MDAPPSYESATGSSSGNQSLNPNPANGIPTAARRSMEDEMRPLPDGWTRQYDSKHGHQFFVDTKAHPPRSTWHHPFDDDQYLATLSPDERKKIEQWRQDPDKAGTAAKAAAEEESHFQKTAGPSPNPQSPSNQPEKPSLGRKWKDKLTNSTHEQREESRRQRMEEERQAFEQHQAFRRAMSRAYETGQPQLVGRDANGKEIYVEPPGGALGHPGGARYYNPHTPGPYSNPNAVFVRPQGPYSRPGYGGGLGLPLAGGLLGGALLGSLLLTPF